jgi:hypothetical protein
MVYTGIEGVGSFSSAPASSHVFVEELESIWLKLKGKEKK